MSRSMALKVAAYQKERKARLAEKRKADAEKARKQWEWDHFEPMVYGSPPANMTQEEVDAQYELARRNHQNIMYGSGRQNQAYSEMGSQRKERGFWSMFLGFGEAQKGSYAASGDDQMISTTALGSTGPVRRYTPPSP